MDKDAFVDQTSLKVLDLSLQSTAHLGRALEGLAQLRALLLTVEGVPEGRVCCLSLATSSRRQNHDDASWDQGTLSALFFFFLLAPTATWSV